jgi:phage antirepressor YoqD-like protein
MPRLGGKKSYHILMDDLKSMKIGRDKLFDILRANHLLIQPKRRYHVTTNFITTLENIKIKFLT